MLGSNGLRWTAVDFVGLRWTALDCAELCWATMTCLPAALLPPRECLACHCNFLALGLARSLSALPLLLQLASALPLPFFCFLQIRGFITSALPLPCRYLASTFLLPCFLIAAVLPLAFSPPLPCLLSPFCFHFACASPFSILRPSLRSRSSGPSATFLQ